jgi:hypothetical protein
VRFNALLFPTAWVTARQSVIGNTSAAILAGVCYLGTLAFADQGEQRGSDRSAVTQITARQNDVSAQVVAIDWSRFQPHSKIKSKPRDLTDCTAIFLNTLAYNLGWASNALGKLDGTIPFAAGEGFQKKAAHNFIRPACNVTFGLAVALQTGVYDEKILGVSRTEARSRAMRLIHGVASQHHGKGWEYPWQSALWAADLGQAAWMLWDDLDGKTRTLVAGLVEWEADRLANTVVPYWNGRGGDTKAEENAWNSMALSLAAATMPNHPHARMWKEKCSEFMISAYSTEADRHNDRVLDGKPVKDWLHGFNANPDGSVVNHGFLHPDYMLCVQLNLRAFVVQPLVGRPVPEGADFNAALVYRCLVTRQWPSPPYAAPGGTIYRPGQPYFYYPERADWSRVNCLTAYLVDTHARVLGLDKGLPGRARDWMRVRAAKILEMQRRHPDRRIWAKGEFDTWPGREQTACGGLGASFLALWLEAQHYPVQKANWLTGQ